MNSPTTSTTSSTHHPMMIIAAVAVILFCLAGTAAIMGWIPSTIGANSNSGELTQSDRAALASRMAEPQQPLIAAEPVRERAPEPMPATDRAPVQLAQAAPAHPHNWCGNCGNVESIHETKTRAQGSGVGAVGGAVLGGLLGNQVGGGNGRKLATVAGAVGGAVVGNQVEGNMKA
ncbi:MAG: glycine zipper 2TM domain-containing protein, partial [Massilia sp.]